ncbi:alpha/beta hydrolase [Iamia majanohamensis]|uniref:Alpha/beta hydrolase n=2 Tax=Iamia majanohamensis TaxID=467976 RepID=A0AAF0BX01_9ACTN|nr:alpha/beta hydrolase [Iamia majanohamensis]WCO68049.1 alpha/beta hydrolase [Iamia majanohamensis]
MAVAVSAWTIAHRRSPAVSAWRPPTVSGERLGRVWCRTGGSGSTGVVLLHGLVATGDVFGSSIDDLAERHVAAAPDLLGFGRSLDRQATDFGSDAHLSALDEAIDRACGDRPLLLGAHSMGSTLALRWAARNPTRVGRIVCLGAPIWPSSHAANEALGGMGPMARALLIDGRLAQSLCELNCAHRNLSGCVAATIAPRWPIPIARQASLHTWEAYVQAVHQQILHADWLPLLRRLDEARIPVEMVWGDQDPIGDVGYAKQLASEIPHLTVRRIGKADHTLPASRPRLLPSLLQAT